jgi:hypothetical protein
MKRRIKFVGFWKDGTVTVVIEGTRYQYQTDALFHDRWKRRCRRFPFKVLNEIKRIIK